MEDDQGSATTTGSAVSWAAADTGPPAGSAGLPVVLVHGWTGSKEDFGPLLDALRVRRRVLAPDMPGHGGTPAAADGDYSLPSQVRFLKQVIDHAGIGDLHLVGHSHGGLLAQRAAWAMAHRIASLTLIGTGPGALGEESREMVIRVATTARDEGMPAAWRVAQEPQGATGGPHDTAPEVTDGGTSVERDRFLAMSPDALIGGARNLITAMPLGAFLRGVDFPVLVCHGEGDTTWLPHEQRLLARSITGATYRVIPDALHSPAQENPEGLLAELLPFLAAADPPVPDPSQG